MVITFLAQWAIVSILWAWVRVEEELRDKRARDERDRANYQRGFRDGADVTLAGVKAAVADMRHDIHFED